MGGRTRCGLLVSAFVSDSMILWTVFSPRIGRTDPGPAPEVEGTVTTKKGIDSSVERLL